MASLKNTFRIRSYGKGQGPGSGPGHSTRCSSGNNPLVKVLVSKDKVKCVPSAYEKINLFNNECFLASKVSFRMRGVDFSPKQFISSPVWTDSLARFGLYVEV